MSQEYTIGEFMYLSDISDTIDRHIDLARTSKDEKERRENRAAARGLILLYKTHTGRKVFYKI